MRLEWIPAAVLSLVLALPAGADHHAKPEAGKWVSLFNGKDLTGWTPKIRGRKAGENYKNTFRVVDGLLTVNYDQYEKFDEQFGHLFWKDEFSHYRLRVEYRFIGEQLAGGPGWALRNSGIMAHGQKPEEMALDQDFPDSIEVQLLGGDGKKKRTTANLCTPGTQVVYKGKLDKRHCISSESKTFHGEQWVTCEVEFRGSGPVKHFINGELVMEYDQPQLNDGTPIGKGTISLQSESHPVQYRKVEVMLLDGKE
ncbi:MAG: DUF1080 domain-containing protein [Akkermansiaceae bacterium]|nr:DUF1080 domain-containing protein [Akkermansiaceae bacterium]